MRRLAISEICLCLGWIRRRRSCDWSVTDSCDEHHFVNSQKLEEVEGK